MDNSKTLNHIATQASLIAKIIVKKMQIIYIILSNTY